VKNLSFVIDKIEKNMDEKEKLREKSLRSCRSIVQLCRKAIQNMYNNSISSAEKNIEKAMKELNDLLENIKEHHVDLFYSGFMENMFQEITEACCLLQIIKNEDLPDPDELKVTYSAYLLGLGDLVGELRRFALDCIINKDVEEANKYLNRMEKIYGILIKFDYPSGFIPLKRKQDVARSLIEKTRGEITVAVCEERIGEKIYEFGNLLDKTEKNKKTKNRKKELDLNIDKVW